MALIIVILITMTIFYGCAIGQQNTINEPLNSSEAMKEAYSKIKLDDGIDKEEAFTLASAYFDAYISGCGAASRDPIDRGAKWEVKTVFGYAAQPYEPIFIDKKTGTITCAKGPTIKAQGK